jgi:hypothetical protein
VLKHHVIPAVPFREFRLAGASDALLLEFPSSVLILQLGAQVAGTLDRFPGRQAVQEEAVVDGEAADMGVGYDDSVELLAALLRFLHEGDRFWRIRFLSRALAELIADLQAVNSFEHRWNAALRLKHHLEAVELETAVVIGGHVG